MKKTGIGIKIICACVLLLLVVYAGGCYYYGNHFQRGTLIDQDLTGRYFLPSDSGAKKRR